MTYIYDIVLNFNNDFYEFYEWDKNDNLTLIKKIPLIKVESDFLDQVFNLKLKIDDPLILEITDKCEVNNKKKKILKYACLLTDSYRIIGILLNNKGEIIKLSDLLLDEAFETLNISKRLQIRNIAYNILGTRNNSYFLTRNEIKIKEYMEFELKRINKENDLEKLKYLYFEFFNKTPTDDLNIYKELLKTINTNLTTNHLKLYKLLKLIHQNVN